MNLRRFRSLHGWETPLVLFGVVLLSYGIWIPWMGLFGNDVPYMYYYHLLGPWGPGDFASVDRPFSAVFYAASTFLLGENVWAYHVFLLLLRWLSAVLLWWVLGLVWPEHKRGAALAALLFAVYPGFRQNPVALEFILHICVLDLFLLSLGASLKAVCAEQNLRDGSENPQSGGETLKVFLANLRTFRQRGQANSSGWQARKPLGSASTISGLESHTSLKSTFLPWLAISMIGASGLFWLEYFIGLEILRPIFLWLVTRRAGLTGRKQWQRILAAWLPVIGVILVFLFWRVFIFSFPTYKPVLLNELRAHPLSGLLNLAKSAARDVWTSLFRAWTQTLHLPAGQRGLLTYLALAAAGLGLVWLLFRRLGDALTAPGTAPDHPGVPVPPGAQFWGESVAVIGLVTMLAGGAIFWLTGIPVTLEFPWDRSTLSLMLGASLVVAGLLEMAVTPRYRPLLAGGLVALALGMHFINAQEYHAEWQKLRDFYWQLTWRAPRLEPGTLVMFDIIPLNRYSDNDMTALLNWTYAPGLHSRQVPYKFFDLTLRLDSDYTGLPGLEKGLPVQVAHRGLTFSSTTSSTLAVTYDPPACLKVLDPADPSQPGVSDRLSKVLPMTSLEQITLTDEPARPPAQLGAEPAHGWCYYYQKADLAHQLNEWAAAAELGNQAFAAGLRSNTPAELLPFIEGYARSGGVDKARQLTTQAAQQPDLRRSLCSLWKRAAEQDPALQAPSGEVQQELGCQP